MVESGAVAASFRDGLKLAETHSEPVLVTGSLFLAGEAVALLSDDVAPGLYGSVAVTTICSSDSSCFTKDEWGNSLDEHNYGGRTGCTRCMDREQRCGWSSHGEDGEQSLRRILGWIKRT